MPPTNVTYPIPFHFAWCASTISISAISASTETGKLPGHKCSIININSVVFEVLRMIANNRKCVLRATLKIECECGVLRHVRRVLFVDHYLLYHPVFSFSFYFSALVLVWRWLEKLLPEHQYWCAKRKRIFENEIFEYVDIEIYFVLYLYCAADS